MTLTTAASNHQPGQPRSRLSMAISTSHPSHMVPLHDVVSPSSQDGNQNSFISQHYGPYHYQREAPQRPLSFINLPATSRTQCDDHDRSSDGYSVASINDLNRPFFRERKSSISIDEADKNPRIQDLSHYIPDGLRSSVSIGGPGEPRELICLCTKPPKIPRPRNVFILYRQYYQAKITALHPGLTNPEISKLIGERWHKEEKRVKDEWRGRAADEAVNHKLQYPDYRYQPRRGGKNRANGKSTLGAAGDDPGHCQKCGGRFIATPRIPNATISTDMMPTFSKPMAARISHQPLEGGGFIASGSAMQTTNSRVVETDHLQRHGSNGSMMSVESHGRRHTQAYHRDTEEDYAIVGPMLPGHKRQRLGDRPAAVCMPHPANLRVAQQRLSISGPVMFATDYGQSPLPRPQYWERQQQNTYRPTHMQPPPPSISYHQAALIHAPIPGATPGFDESLRLPPLQTHMSGSPSMNLEASGMNAAILAQGSGHGIMNPNAPPSSRGHSLSPSARPQWLFKLEMLRAISPPLYHTARGAPPFEVRGPILALEGASPNVLKEVTAVVEKALSMSGECAVKIWTDHQGDDGQDGANDFTNPVAKFQARMLQWHRTSEELVDYVTHHHTFSPHNPNDVVELERSAKPYPATRSSTINTANTTASVGDRPLLPSKLPVAVLGEGYSLTIVDRDTAALHIADAYRPDDHWRWVATMWRGIVGADLTIYIQQCTADEVRVSQVVEFADSGVLVVKVPESNGGSDGPGVVDETLDRRLGFELIEWVRGRHFGRGSI